MYMFLFGKWCRFRLKFIVSVLFVCCFSIYVFIFDFFFVIVWNMNGIFMVFVSFFSCCFIIFMFVFGFGFGIGLFMFVICKCGGFLGWVVSVWIKVVYCVFWVMLKLMIWICVLFWNVFVMVLFVVMYLNLKYGYILYRICIVDSKFCVVGFLYFNVLYRLFLDKVIWVISFFIMYVVNCCIGLLYMDIIWFSWVISMFVNGWLLFDRVFV